MLDSFRRSGVALSYSLSSFMPAIRLSCPQLVAALPINSSSLRSPELLEDPGSSYDLVALLSSIDVRTRCAPVACHAWSKWPRGERGGGSRVGRRSLQLTSTST